MTTRTLWLLGFALFFVAAQLIPVDTHNPPVRAALAAPADVKQVLEQSCYDCHSNETRWPWYARVAPVSWLVAHDVEEGREHLNFSEWGELSAKDQSEARHEVWEEVEEGEMPLWFYLPLHPQARLSDSDRSILEAWAGGAASHGSKEH